MKYLKSPLNYIGGKYKLLPQILPHFPTEINRFVDLFAGGCNVGINVTAEKVICTDINTRIVEMFQAFHKLDPDAVIDHIERKITQYGLSKTNEDGFIRFRQDYNASPAPLDLYVLSCYSFNYQFRFNNNLQYNNPFGRDRSSFSPQMKTNLLAFMERVKGMDILFAARDFMNMNLSKLGAGDMVYCDPPYIITTGSYNDGNRGFKDWREEQEKALYALLDQLHNQGVRFALSNVLTHKGACNEVLSAWSTKYTVHHLNYNYSNSSHNTQSGDSDEVLVTNY